jgi:hypothetical protein
MAKSTAFDIALTQMIFNGSTTATGTTLFANPASSPATNLYCALHTADPGVAGTQATNEITYTGYARAAVIRTSAGWTVNGMTGAISPTQNINFPAGTGGSGTATFVSIGTSGGSTTPGTATPILYSGPLSPTIVCGTGVTPVLASSSALTEA